MTTFGTMVDRIKRETRRTTTEDEDKIKEEIVSAIHDYRMLRFPWNEKEFTLTTSDGDFDYDFPTQDVDSNTIEVLDVDWLKIDINNTWYDLVQYPIQLIEEYKYSDTNNKSWPAYFAIVGTEFIFYPVPNDTYTIRGRCLADINEVTTDSDVSETNAWFTKGERIIRSRAKVSFFRNYVGNSERADDARKEEIEAYEAIKLYADRLALGGPAIPWC